MCLSKPLLHDQIFSTFECIMRALFIPTLLIILSTSCSKNPQQLFQSELGMSHTVFFFLFQNKEAYYVQVGDVVPIYYTNNSCCFSCAPNKHELNHLEFLDEKVLVPIMKHCEGCDQMHGMFFRAKSVGVDTILRQNFTPGFVCDKTLKGFEQFIVHVH